MLSQAADLIQIPYFISYAHADDRLKQGMLGRLGPRLAITKGISFQHWDDRRLLVGEEWEAGILDAVTACRLGLLLLSPAFFASTFIRSKELPRLVAEKRLIPVALRALPLDGSADLAGIERLQIFPYPFGKPFSECRDGIAKDRFADDLRSQIVQVVQHHVAPNLS